MVLRGAAILYRRGLQVITLPGKPVIKNEPLVKWEGHCTSYPPKIGGDEKGRIGEKEKTGLIFAKGPVRE